MNHRKKCLGKSRVKNHLRSKCKECRRFYAKAWRATKNGKKYSKARNSKIYGTHMEKAKRAVFVQIRAGKLKKPNKFKCIKCAAPAAVYDHRNYLKPLKVRPVCYSCNRAMGAGLNRI